VSEVIVPLPRRDFLGAVAVAGAALAVGACATATGAAASNAGMPPMVAAPPATEDGPFDHAWLDRLTAKHKQIFDLPSYEDGGGLALVRNYLNGLRDGFGAEPPDVHPVAGIHGDAAPIVFSDAIWAKYQFGKESKTKDPRTGAWALRNVYWKVREGEDGYESAVDRLQSRNCQFLFCNNVMRFMARSMAARHGTTYAAMRAELVGGLLPGVVVVPAMVVALGLAQERGCAYVYAG